MKYFAIIFILLSTGCSTKYILPAESDTNKASVKVIHLSEHQNSSTTVSVYDNEDCKETSGYGRLAFLGQKLFVPGESITSSLKAHEKLFLTIRAGGNVHNYKYNYYRTYECNTLVSFTPEKGAEYEISIIKPESLCKATVIDTKTGKDIKGLQYHEFKKSCRGSWVY